MFFYKLAFAHEPMDFELYGFDILNQSEEINNISELYFGENYANKQSNDPLLNNGYNKPVFNDISLALAGQRSSFRFWFKEFNFEQNQEFEYLLKNCERQCLLERQNFLFFDEEIEDVVIKQEYDLKILFPKNLFKFDSLNCNVGYFDPIDNKLHKFIQRRNLFHT